MEKSTNKLNDVTFIFPLRVDCKEREANLNTVLHLLHQETEASFIVLEADSQSKLNLTLTAERVSYIYVKDEDPIFHRTKYLNQMLRQASTPIVGLWDTDVILRTSQIIEASEAIRKSNTVMSFPYNGHFLTTTSDIAEKFRKELDYEILSDSYSLYGQFAVGGAFLVDKDKYLQAGGENEHFYGWGPEDAERLKRMEILDLPIDRAKGPLFHLYHPRGSNSRFFDEKRKVQNLKEFLKICAMNKKELSDYIRTW